MTPPAMTTPRICGGGYVSGTLTRSVAFPASDRRSGHVAARIDAEETGSRRVAPGRYSRMSKTPWPPGSRPVRKVGQAAPAVEQTAERGELAGGEQRVENVPVGAVPADDEHAVGHGRGG